MTTSKLYILATPLGNRGDITLRALETLRQVTVFFAEDTREFKKLLELYEISAQGKQIFSYAAHNMKDATAHALRLLGEGNNVVLATDRGTPGISDPGAQLVHAAFFAGVSVLPIPGVSSPAAIASVCPFDMRQFFFQGFLPTKKKDRDALFAQFSANPVPVVVFESPNRIRETVEELAKLFPEGEIFFGREMTKLHEEYFHVRLKELDVEKLQERGEYSFVFLPPAATKNKDGWEKEIETRLLPDKAWAKQIAESYGVAASDIYNALQQKKRGS